MMSAGRLVCVIPDQNLPIFDLIKIINDNILAEEFLQFYKQGDLLMIIFRFKSSVIYKAIAQIHLPEWFPPLESDF